MVYDIGLERYKDLKIRFLAKTQFLARVKNLLSFRRILVLNRKDGSNIRMYTKFLAHFIVFTFRISYSGC